ncbi:MAB_1171c family putative transporter [Streptomyces sp. NBC_01497]|uniref:MAB_1171c family putative transporter n=1 Tax=Streptomyces sp. NBC_01497 TaxID=2903885 RepID=UPI002E365B1E|nr:MAB_1171c family putative transporter [Streptomyces sp. NBC_01497]
MVDLASLFAACLFLAFSVHRLAITRRARTDPAQRYLAGFGLCLGAAMLVYSPVVTRLPAWSGTFARLDIVATDDLRMATFFFLRLVALALTAPATASSGSRWRRLGPGAVVITVSTCLYFTAHVTTHDGRASVPDGRRWALASHNALFALYGTWCLALLVRGLIRHMRRIEPGPLRTGLRLMALAVLMGMVWTLWTLDDVVDNLTLGLQETGEDQPSAMLGSLTAVLATTGATATLWGGRIGAPVRWLRAYRRYRALEPLWRALHAQLPQIALDPSAADRGPGPRHAEFALYRRVIEIRDGLLALRPYFDRAVPARTGEPQDRAPEQGPVQEAACIAAALDNLRAGRRQDDGPTDRLPPSRSPGVPGTLEAETAWLLQVTAALTTSYAVPRRRPPAPATPRLARLLTTHHASRPPAGGG